MKEIRKHIENLNLKTRLHGEHESLKDENKFRDIMLSGFDKMESLKDKYKDRKILVMGLGPSLMDLDKKKYKDFLKIAVNDFYRVPNFFNEDFKPDFWCGANSYDALKDPYSMCLNEGITAFITIPKKTEFEKLLYEIDHNSINSIPWLWQEKIFQKMLAQKYNLTNAYSRCNTITNHAIAFAIWLGCSEIHVTGFDLSYGQAYKKTGNTHAGFTTEETMKNKNGHINLVDSFDNLRERKQILSDLKYFCKIAYRNDMRICNLSHKENKLPYNLSFRK